MTCYDPFLFSGAPAAHQALWMERSEMRPVLWVPGLYARLVELPAGTNTSPAEAAVSYGVPVDIPAHGGVGLGPRGLWFWLWTPPLGHPTGGQGDTLIGELGGSAESPGPRE